MIAIQDDYLTKNTFEELQRHVLEAEFLTYKAGDKEFLAIPPPKFMENLLVAEGHDIILSFIRKAHKDFDTEPRIHADGIINGSRASLASVLYINQSEGVTPNGTAFYDHFIYGKSLPERTNPKEFDILLTEDSNDLSKWKETDRIMARPNRLAIYNANYFHAKWPNRIDEGERTVLVTFYTKKQKDHDR